MEFLNLLPLATLLPLYMLAFRERLAAEWKEIDAAQFTDNQLWQVLSIAMFFQMFGVPDASLALQMAFQAVSTAQAFPVDAFIIRSLWMVPVGNEGNRTLFTKASASMTFEEFAAANEITMPGWNADLQRQLRTGETKPGESEASFAAYQRDAVRLEWQTLATRDMKEALKHGDIKGAIKTGMSVITDLVNQTADAMSEVPVVQTSIPEQVQSDVDAACHKTREWSIPPLLPELGAETRAWLEAHPEKWDEILNNVIPF